MDTENPANSRVEVTVRTASIDTRVPARDAHLRTADFFAVDCFPTMTFRSTSVTMDGRHIRVMGNLTIRGRTRPVTLTGTYEGIFPDPWGGTRTAFTATTTVNRHDFGVSFDGPCTSSRAYRSVSAREFEGAPNGTVRPTTRVSI